MHVGKVAMVVAGFPLHCMMIVAIFCTHTFRFVLHILIPLTCTFTASIAMSMAQPTPTCLANRSNPRNSQKLFIFSSP